jgi:prepilin-type N-terminal cleavage/methylation domain-containing protein
MSKSRANAFNLTGGAGGRLRPNAFSLLEVLTALAILAFASSSVLYVINRCMASTANSALQMEAFQVARENMEQVLVSDSVVETVEYGTSELYPDISWQTAIEAFSEPVSGEMWTRAICSAEYRDSTGETQTIELVHWIGPLTDQQADQLLEEEDLELLAAEQLVETIEEAVEYAGVDAVTIEEWVQNGMLTTEEGAFLRYNLDIYIQSGGTPSEEDQARQVGSIEELAMALQAEQGIGDEAPGTLEGRDGVDPTTGLPYDELEQMEVGEVMDRLRNRQDRSR